MTEIESITFNIIKDKKLVYFNDYSNDFFKGQILQGVTDFHLTIEGADGELSEEFKDEIIREQIANWDNDKERIYDL